MNRKPWFCQDCRIQMVYNDKRDFYKCPECGTEVWYIDEHSKNKDEIQRMMEDLYKTHLPKKECLPAGQAIPGGSHSSKSKKRKSAKKESLATLNRKLYVEM